MRSKELTQREHEVARLIVKGKSNKLIAGALAISEHTVKFHAGNFIAKMGAGNRIEAAVKYALFLEKNANSMFGATPRDNEVRFGTFPP